MSLAVVPQHRPTLKPARSAAPAALILVLALASGECRADEPRFASWNPGSSSPAGLPDPEPPDDDDGPDTLRLAAVLGLGAACLGGYVAYGFGFWWKEDPREFHMTREGNMEQDSYAGGSDKFGHAFACYAMTRGFGGLLRWTGLGPAASEIVSALVVQAVYLGSEIEDAFYDYGFSFWDVAFNAAGSILAALLDLVPWLDRALDFRFWYASTSRFKYTDYNMAEDYSGQKYFLVFKLDGIPALRKTALRYLEIYAGYYAVGYKPKGEKRERHLFFGVSVDVFGLIKDFVCPALGAPKFARDATALVGEYWHPHFVHAPVADFVLR